MSLGSIEFIYLHIFSWVPSLALQVLGQPYICFKASELQYIPRNMHTVFALLRFVVVIHWLIFPYSPGLLHWHCGNLTIAPVPAKQPWWIWINTSCEFIMNDCITTTKQSTTKPCAYFLGYTVIRMGVDKSEGHLNITTLDILNCGTFTDMARIAYSMSFTRIIHQGPLLLTWFNFNPSMDM